MSTRAKVILISAISLVVIATIAAVATFLIIQKQHDDDVKEADAAAAAYVDEVAEFRELAADELGESGSDSPTQTVEAAEGLEDELPTLDDAPEYGRENSKEYAAAQQTQTRLDKDLTAVVRAAQHAVDAAAFVSAGRTALDADVPIDLIGPGPFENGDPIRETTIPGMQAVKDDFLAVEVPEGLEDAQGAVVAALDHVINELNTMAASLDQVVSYNFPFGEQYGDGLDALQAAEDDAREPLDDSIDTLVEGDADV